MSLKTSLTNGITILPNPVKDVMQLQVNSVANSTLQMNIYDAMGKLIKNIRVAVQRGNNVITLDDLASQPRGVYHAMITIGDDQFHEKILVVR